MDIVKDIKDNTFIVFLVCFIVYYFVVVNKDPKGVFFIMVSFIVVYSLYAREKARNEKKNASVDSFITAKEIGLNGHEIPEDKTLYVHKLPRNLKFVKKTKEFRDVLYDLRFLEYYDFAMYEKMLAYVEHFLRLHYKVMIGKYDFEHYFPILKDIRNEIMNTMKTMVFNTPSLNSTYVDVADLEAFIDERVIVMQSITYKYIRSLYHKYNKVHMSYNAPYENDVMKDMHYHVF